MRRWSLLVAVMLTINVSLFSLSGAKPAYAWTCAFPHCFGIAKWGGATWGTWTNIYVKDLSLTTTDPSFLSQEVWLDDTNVNAWAEIGYYVGYPNSYSVTSYFYAYQLPNNGAYIENRIGQVPVADKNGYTSFKITRNRPTTTTLLLAAVSVAGTTNFSIVINTTQGGSNWAGNLITVGSELDLITDSNPSSNGDIRWKANKWQLSDGTYVAQVNGGSVVDDAHQNPSWETVPATGNDGGTFKNWCCSVN
jgi:hypothetical protein